VHTVGFPETAADAAGRAPGWKTRLTEAWRNQEDVIFGPCRSSSLLRASRGRSALCDCEAAVVLPLLVSDRALGVGRAGYPRPTRPPRRSDSFLASARSIRACARSRHPIRAGAAGTRQCRGVSRAAISSSANGKGGGGASRKRSQVSALAARTNRLYTLSRPLRGGELEAIGQGHRPGEKVAGASSGFVACCRRGAVRDALQDENPPQNGEQDTASRRVRTLRHGRSGESPGSSTRIVCEWQQHYPQSAAAAADGGYASAAVLPCSSRAP